MTIEIQITTTEVGTTEEVTTLVEVAGAGPQGAKGDTGPGVPDGGTTGQVLVKASDDDQDTDWSSDYATAAQGSLADSAIQPLDNVSELTNDANYIDASGAPVQSVNTQTGAVTLTASDVGADPAGSASTVQSNLDTHTGDLTNPHSVTKAQVGLSDVDNVSAADLRDRSTHTGTQTLSTISDAGTIASQDANSVNIDGGAIDATDIGVATPATVSSDNYLTADNYPTIKPSLNLDFANTKTLDPRVTFARASTATYYDGQTVAKAEENLLIQSNVFTSNWINESGTTITFTADTGDTTAPEGTSTATKWENNTGGRIYRSTQDTPAGRTFSVFAKAGTGTWLLLRPSGNSGGVWFDLSTGALGTESSGYSGSIISAGNGWYRCSVETTNTSGLAYIYLVNADASGSNASSGSTIYLWGAQLEQRDSVTTYTPTTTQPITNYIPVLQTASSGDPRFDHDPITGESKGLLIEEQRTNLLTYSESFDDSDWGKTNASIDSNTIVAPDGTLTGDKFVVNTVLGSHDVRQSPLLTSGVTYTFSAFIKKGEYNFVVFFSQFSGTGYGSIRFDLLSGTVSDATSGALVSDGAIINVGNGWYKCSYTFSATSTGTSITGISGRPDAAFVSFTGDDYSGIYIWGAQLEQASFPTSYIKTEGSQVTRVADGASMTGTNFSDWYRQDEGTLYGESFAPSNYIAQIDAGNNNNRISIINSNITQAFVLANASIQANLDAGTISTSSVNKYALGYKVNDFAISLNNSAVATDTDGILPIVNRLNIGCRANPADQNINGHIKRLAYYPQRLPNATLQALTEE